MEYYYIFCLLSICGWYDWKRKRIPCISLWLGMTGIILITIIQCSEGNRVWWNSVMGATIGILLILVSIVTHQQIGLGDGILFVITGIGLGIINNILLLVSSLCLVSIISLILISIKKVGRKTTLPFVPFVWFCFVMEMISLKFL